MTDPADPPASILEARLLESAAKVRRALAAYEALKGRGVSTKEAADAIGVAKTECCEARAKASARRCADALREIRALWWQPVVLEYG